MIAPKQITLTIDGKSCKGEAGQTILEIARANGVVIPTLCYLKGLTSWGGCRLCIVEIQGNPKVVPSCATPATDGSVITTNSPRLINLRRQTLELLFSERNHFCPMCPYNKGDCGLQHQAYVHGMDSVRFQYLYPALPVDLTSKYFGIDHNRCILCTRCVRTCDEVEGVHTLDISNRGEKNRVVVDLGAQFGQSETCTLCGACVASCPTGALFDKAAAFRGPLASCQAVPTTCTECALGCGLKVFTREDRIVDVWGDPDSPVNRGHLCHKGRYETWAAQRDRVTQPLLRRDGKLVPVSWAEAVQAVKAAATQAPKFQTGLLVSPRVTNETAGQIRRVADKFDRVGMFVARHEAPLVQDSGDAKAGPATAGLEAISDADAIILLGAQPSRDNGVAAARIRTAVRKRGAKLLIFHARKSDLDQLADVCANVVSVEHKLWDKVAATLAGAVRPVIVYGPAAMTPIGVTAMEKLIAVFEKQAGGQEPKLVPLPVTANARGLAAAGLEPLEEIGPWLDATPLSFLHIVASDEPDGGAGLLDERYVRPLLEQVEFLSVQTAYLGPLAELAHVVLPAAIWAEKEGTVTNFEGRSLPVRPVVPAAGAARRDEAILEAVFA